MLQDLKIHKSLALGGSGHPELRLPGLTMLGQVVKGSQNNDFKAMVCRNCAHFAEQKWR